MSEHTPGPWTIEDPFGPDVLAIVPAGKPTYEWVIIATCSHDEPEDDRPCITKQERDANARLIAASPDLLAALKAMIVASQDDNWGRSMAGELPAARAAIARAEGAP